MATGALPVSDVEKLLDIVHELSQPAPLQTLREQTVAWLPGLIPASLTSWNEVDLAHGTTIVVSDEVGEPDPALFASFQQHIATHPVVEHTARTGDGRPCTISDFLTEEQFHATALYRTFFRHKHTEDQLSCALPDPDAVIGIALNRDARTFRARDRTLLNLCRPHLISARRTAIAYERAQWYLHTLEHLVERGGEGLLVIDGSGRTMFASPNADQLLRSWFDAAALPPAWSSWLAGPGEPLVERRGGRALDVDRLPGPDPSSTALLLRESGPSPRDLAALRRIGLTAREGEVLVLVAQGRTNAAIAVRLGISVRTVEKHMQFTMHKLGATNRVQAAALVRDLRLPGITG